MLGLGRRSIAQILLLASLLAAQALVLSHETEHELRSGNDQCWICLHATPFKAVAPASAPQPTPSVEPAGDRLSLPAAATGRRLGDPGARGPPTTLPA